MAIAAHRSTPVGGGWSHRWASPLVVSRFVADGARHVFGVFGVFGVFWMCVFLDFGGELVRGA